MARMAKLARAVPMPIELQQQSQLPSVSAGANQLNSVVLPGQGPVASSAMVGQPASFAHDDYGINAGSATTSRRE